MSSYLSSGLQNAELLAGIAPVSPVTLGAIAFTIMFAIFYIATASIGVQTYNKCEEIQGVKKWDNIKMLLSHTMTIGMAIPAVLMAQYFVGGKVTAAMAILYGIMGLIGNATAFAVTKEGSCGEYARKDSKNYLIFGMVASLLVMMAGGAYMTMSR
jgi:hypothetical protein